MIRDCVVLGFLLILAWIDYKKQEVPLGLLIFLGGNGIFMRWKMGELEWPAVLGGMAVGIVLFLCMILTHESIGAGDAFLFMATGIYLGFWQNLLLLFWSVLCCAIFSFGFMVGKKCTRKQKIPFLPFVLTGDVILLALRG